MNKKLGKERRGGMSLVGLLIWVVIVAGGVLVVFSDPIRADVKRGWQRITQWDSAAVHKNPELYSSWAVDECEKVQDALYVRRMDLLTQKARLRREQALAETRATHAESLLREARAVYKSAEQLNHWPTPLAGGSFSKAEFRDRILEIDVESRSAESIAHCTQQLLPEVELQLRQTAGLLADVQQVMMRAHLSGPMTEKSPTQATLQHIKDRLGALGALGLAPVGELERMSPSTSMMISHHSGQMADQDRFDSIMSAQ